MTQEEITVKDLQELKKILTDSKAQEIVCNFNISKEIFLEIVKIAIRKEMELKTVFQKIIKTILVFDRIELDPSAKVVLREESRERELSIFGEDKRSKDEEGVDYEIKGNVIYLKI